ncbi:MAG: hypothetical protein JWO38_5818 [Gemmataceae bacterium]|nr:hypothetical protein [Gemmataceae bacterium]
MSGGSPARSDVSRACPARAPLTRESHTTSQSLGEPYEVIVANDASTDRTGEIAREQAEEYIGGLIRVVAFASGTDARGQL